MPLKWLIHLPMPVKEHDSLIRTLVVEPWDGEGGLQKLQSFANGV